MANIADKIEKLGNRICFLPCSILDAMFSDCQLMIGWV